MASKYRQLSMFTDRDVQRSALCRAFENPPRRLIQEFRFETIYGVLHPVREKRGVVRINFRGALVANDSFNLATWNVLRHHNGPKRGSMEKIGRRYYYASYSAPVCSKEPLNDSI